MLSNTMAASCGCLPAGYTEAGQNGRKLCGSGSELLRPVEEVGEEAPRPYHKPLGWLEAQRPFPEQVCPGKEYPNKERGPDLPCISTPVSMPRSPAWGGESSCREAGPQHPHHPICRLTG